MVVLLLRLIPKVSLPVVGMTSINACDTPLCLKAMKGPSTYTKENVLGSSWDTCTSHPSRHQYKAYHRPLSEASILTVTDTGGSNTDRR